MVRSTYTLKNFLGTTTIGFLNILNLRGPFDPEFFVSSFMKCINQTFNVQLMVSEAATTLLAYFQFSTAYTTVTAVVIK